jgi:ATP-binding cassette subfamily B protein/subfamily B ATP-binding cassette protein MsbA
MKNFGRSLALACRSRWTLVGLVLSSCGVALCWGGNLVTIYPIVDVVLRGRSLRQWVDANIEESTRNCIEWEAELARLATELHSSSPLDSKRIERQHAYIQSRLIAERQAIETATWLRPWIHRYMPSEPFPTLGVVVVALLLGTIFKACFLVTNVVLVHRISQLATFDLRKLLFRRTLGLDMESLGRDRTPHLLSHFTHDLENLKSGLHTAFGRTIGEPLKIIACLLGAAWICWRLLVFSLLVTPVAIYLINRLAKSVKRASRKAMEDMAHLYVRLSEALAGIQVVKAYTMERYERWRFHQAAKDYMRRSLKAAIYNALNKPATELMSIGVVALAILAGGYLVLNDATHLLGIRMCNRPLNFGALMTFFALLAGVSDPFRKLAEVYNDIQRSVAAADRIYAVLDRPPLHRHRRGGAPPSELKVLTFDHVGFRYHKSVPVLTDISFQIQAGETLAIVGPNGCGKSTLISLIPRFYDPTEGQVAWNGVDLRQFHCRKLREKIGIVTQQTILFDDTVLNNIRYGSLRATDAQVVAAARQAHADQFITEKLANGYQTIVGEGGLRLSGGQRQRIALARALLRNPELLILDEATSQIDPESSRLIRDALASYARHRTAVLVTHRFETLEIASRILVINEGQLVDIGTHAQLIGRCRLYNQLCRSQWKIPA